jgi:hypothetical protein
MSNIYIKQNNEACLHLCNPDSTQMGRPFNQTWSHFLLMLFTSADMLQNVNTIKSACYYILLQNLLFICLY